MDAGDALRLMREKLGLTLRDVEAASMRLAQIHGNPDMGIAISRISDIETKGLLPSIFRLYSFAVIYRTSIQEMMALFGLDVNQISSDSSVISPSRTHKTNILDLVGSVRMPIQIDPAFNPASTTNFGRMIVRWGSVPMTFLQQFENTDFTYGYVGTEDFTMYPLLLPGSFVQIDEAMRKVGEKIWRSEYERPIYFVQTRDGFTCSWCEQEGQNMVLLPHPLSPVKIRTLRHDRDVEIIGQVVAVAMRLDWSPEENGAASKLLSKSS